MSVYTGLTTDDETKLVNFITSLDLDVMTNVTRRIASENSDYDHKADVQNGKFSSQFKHENGEYFPRYLYRDNDSYVASDILGLAFVQMGVDYDVIAIIESLEDSSFESAYNLMYAVFTEDEAQRLAYNPKVRWLETVQAAQDLGYTWGVAIKYADDLRRKIETEQNPELKLKDILKEFNQED